MVKIVVNTVFDTLEALQTAAIDMFWNCTPRHPRHGDIGARVRGIAGDDTSY